MASREANCASRPWGWIVAGRQIGCRAKLSFVTATPMPRQPTAAPRGNLPIQPLQKEQLYDCSDELFIIRIISIGSGKMIVEFFSAPISVSVCR